MLCELLIKNFAIIDDLNIRFSGGLTILTGETGAGKSIIINAVSLLLGGRATPKMIRTGADTAELEALFQIAAKSPLAQTIADLGYDISDGLLVKRVVSRNERHRIYINGHIATTQALSAITGHLASISGQFAHQGILKEYQQLLTLDQFGGLLPLREQIFADYHRILPLIEELRNLESKKLRQSEHIDLLQYQKKEIAEAALFPGEDNGLEMERNRLKNAESLYEKIYSGIESLYGGKGAVVERLVEIKKNMDSASRIDPSLTAKMEGITEATFRIEEVVEHLRNYLSQISVDENRLEAIEARLDVIQKLKRKYGGSIESVLDHLQSIEKELSGIEDLPIEIEKIKRELSVRHVSILKAATDISQKRGETARILSEK
ncbi:MAG: AAA family ATPase, partial [Pseudomonadota bacterium]